MLARRPRTGPGKRALWHWIIAAFLMAGAVVYQRATGPTYPSKGTFEVAGATSRYRFPRSDWSNRTQGSTLVSVPCPHPGITGTLHWRRFPTDEAFTVVPLRAESERSPERAPGGVAASEPDSSRASALRAAFPAQPAAGKVEYYVVLRDPSGREFRLPPHEDGNVVLRFKDHVPVELLLPHVFLMFFAVLIGMRAGLGAILSPSPMRRWAWVALTGMTLGGMILGPIVQKHAFGAYWTGFPLGRDWTDNKMLVMWLSWVLACAAAGTRPRKDERVARAAVVLGALIMTVAYLVPHSMGGSELDYDAVEQGVSPTESVRTGRR